MPHAIPEKPVRPKRPRLQPTNPGGGGTKFVLPKLRIFRVHLLDGKIPANECTREVYAHRIIVGNSGECIFVQAIIDEVLKIPCECHVFIIAPGQWRDVVEVTNESIHSGGYRVS